MKNIRNFSIVAHIDHGKTTLSDRILEDTGTIPKRKMHAQLLDGMDLERERGITIKAKAVRIKYKDYILNLIDTPGHVDFSYEVARSLRACEGVLLLVDASQGVEAQTVAHAHLAQSLGLKIIPVINKVDLSQSDADIAEEQLWEVLKEPISAQRVSAKTGLGIEDLLERIGSFKTSQSCSSAISASLWLRSTLFITGIILSPKLCARWAWATVCASTPWDASTKSKTPSQALKLLATS